MDAARHMGCIFKGRESSYVLVDFFGKLEKIEILESFEFDSDRKRMSVVLKHNGSIKVFCKGADNIILSRLKDIESQPFVKNNTAHLDDFSKKGLRTLCLAMKALDEEEYLNYKELLRKARLSDNKAMEIANVADKIERELFLIGVTAVEDRLQDQVPETIQELLKAGKMKKELLFKLICL